MTALALVVTRRGMERFTAAQLGEDIDLSVTEVGVSDQAFVAAPTLTALPGEFRRIDTVSGRAVGDDIVHLVLRDDIGTGYAMRGFGLYLTDGTLFATYAQPDRLVEKSARVALHFAIDIAFPSGTVAQLTFGATDFLNPPATTETRGVVELATAAEADAGTPGLLAVTAALLKRAIDALRTSLSGRIDYLTTATGQAIDALAARTIYGSGLVKGGGNLTANRTLTVDGATAAQLREGVRGDIAATPSALAAAGAVYVVASQIGGGAGHRVWSDGLKECWGAIAVPANSTVRVNLPIAHDETCIPAGTCSIDQDEASIGALNANAGGFDVRNRNPKGTTFYWHTKGR